MSQLDPVKETIDGHEYTMVMLDPTVAAKLLRRIMFVVSPAVGAFAVAGGKELTPELFSMIAGGLFERLDEKLLDDVISRMSSVTIVDGKKMDQVFMIHFRGRIGHMIKWIAFAMRVQYADFLSEIRNVISRAGEMTPQVLASQLI